MRKIRRILILLLCVCLIGSGLYETDVEAATFIPRLTEPSTTDKYWIHTSNGGLNECIIIQGNSCLPNCVGYAWGRAYEILGKKPNLSKGNANVWWDYNIQGGYYGYGQTPKLGAIMCWGYSPDGHVAVVEAISGDTITISESEYSGRRWNKETRTIKEMQNRYSNFQGYIYLGEYSGATDNLVAPNISGITVSGSDVTINWNAISGATCYNIQLCDGAWTTSQWFSTNSTSYTFENMSDGVWTVRIGSQNEAGKESYSGYKYFTLGIPETPVIKSVTVSGYDVTLEWDTCDNALEYAIQLCDGNWETSQWFFTTSTKYTFENLDSGTWVARVVSINTAGDEKKSEYKYFDVAIPEIPFVTDTIINGNNVTLKWNTCKNTVNYNIQLCDEGWTTSQWFSTTDTSYTFNNLKEGIWRYRVGSENSKGYEKYDEYHTFTVGHDHSYGQWIVETEASCEENGTERRDCGKCEYYEIRAIEELGHNYKSKTTEPTCTENGHTTHTCERCGEGYIDAEVEAIGHSLGSWLTIQKATCEAKGIQRRDCTNCDYYETKLVAAFGHTWNSGMTTKAATCKTTGVKTYTCTVCSTTKTETITKLTTHTYSNNCDKSCNVCKATRTITHTYKTTTTKATLSKNGSIVKKCTVCGKVASNTAIKYVKTFKLSETSYTYNGSVKTPTVTVKDSSGKTLKKNTDYTVTYASGRKNTGTYNVTVKMKGNYSGTKTLTFKINPAKLSSYKLSATSYTYDGKVKKPTVTVKNSSGTKLTTSSYTVTYASGRKNVGTYKVTIKGKGNYTGSKTLTFKINPVKTTISKLTAGKKKITVAITKKSTQITGYQIQYSTSKKFSKATTKTISSYKTTKYTLKSLSAKKTYYVKVRTYKTVNGTKYYSGWSTYKYVKTK